MFDDFNEMCNDSEKCSSKSVRQPTCRGDNLCMPIRGEKKAKASMKNKNKYQKARSVSLK